MVVRTKKGYYVDMKGLFVQAREVDAIASFGTFTVEDPKLKTLICEDNDDVSMLIGMMNYFRSYLNWIYNLSLLPTCFSYIMVNNTVTEYIP